MTPRLWVESRGAGARVVLLHGWGMHGGLWEDVVEALVDRHRVVVVDLPGHGRSPSMAAAESADLLAVSRRVAAAVGSQPAAWVGWSLGGLIALQAALTQPWAVQRLAMVGSSACFVSRADWHCAMDRLVLESLADTLETDYEMALRRFLALEVHGLEHAAEHLRRLRAIAFQHGRPSAEALRGGLEILIRSDLRPWLRDLRPPLLLLQGRRDNLVPAAAAAATAASVPAGQVRIIEGAGHAPFLTHQAVFLEHLLAFLSG